jgi:hypothetical protein
VEGRNLHVEEEYRHGLTRHHQPDWRATEKRIRSAMITAGSPNIPPSHTWLRSLILLIEEILSPSSRRYDATGLWARAAVTQ